MEHMDMMTPVSTNWTGSEYANDGWYSRYGSDPYTVVGVAVAVAVITDEIVVTSVDTTMFTGVVVVALGAMVEANLGPCIDGEREPSQRTHRPLAHPMAALHALYPRRLFAHPLRLPQRTPRSPTREHPQRLWSVPWKEVHFFIPIGFQMLI